MGGRRAGRVFGTATVARAGLVALTALTVLTLLTPPAAAAPPTAGPGAGSGVGAGVGPGARWRWPLPAPPTVLRRFDPPATPFSAGHRGVDLAGAIGTPITAAGAGVVGFAGRVAGRGVVTVLHPALRTTYEPVEATVRVGQRVEAGTQLGWLSAPTGHCGPGRSCLHWGAVRGGEYVDPLLLVGAVGVRLLPLLGGRPSRVGRGLPMGAMGALGSVDAVSARPGRVRSAAPRPGPAGPPARSAGHPTIGDRASRTPDRAAEVAAAVLVLGGLSGLALRRARRGR